MTSTHESISTDVKQINIKWMRASPRKATNIKSTRHGRKKNWHAKKKAVTLVYSLSNSIVNKHVCERKQWNENNFDFENKLNDWSERKKMNRHWCVTSLMEIDFCNCKWRVSYLTIWNFSRLSIARIVRQVHKQRNQILRKALRSSAHI